MSKVAILFFKPIERVRADVGDAVGQILVALARAARWPASSDPRAVCSSAAFSAFQALRVWSIWSKVHLQRFVAVSRAASPVDFLLQLFDLLAQRVLTALAVGDFDLVGQRADVAAHFLERLVERQRTAAPVPGSPCRSIFGGLRDYGLLGGLHLPVELLILAGKP